MLAKERVAAAEAAFNNKASELVLYHNSSGHMKSAPSAAMNTTNGATDNGTTYRYLSVDGLTPPRVPRKPDIPIDLIRNGSSPVRAASLESISMGNGMIAEMRGDSLTRRHEVRHDVIIEERTLRDGGETKSNTAQNPKVESPSMRSKSASPFSVPVIDRGTPSPTSGDHFKRQDATISNGSPGDSNGSPRGSAMERPSSPAEVYRSAFGGTAASLGEALWGRKNGSKHNSPRQPPRDAYIAETTLDATNDVATGTIDVSTGSNARARAEAEAAAAEVAKLRSEQLELTAGVYFVSFIVSFRQ